MRNKARHTQHDDLHTKTHGIRVPAPLAGRLEAQARRENNTLSAVMRRLLTEALDREDARVTNRVA